MKPFALSNVRLLGTMMFIFIFYGKSQFQSQPIVFHFQCWFTLNFEQTENFRWIRINLPDFLRPFIVLIWKLSNIKHPKNCPSTHRICVKREKERKQQKLNTIEWNGFMSYNNNYVHEIKFICSRIQWYAPAHIARWQMHEIGIPIRIYISANHTA